MNFFFKPRPGVIGDTIPYYFDGRYHVFYLRAFRDNDSYDIGTGWEHISTTDFVHFEDHGVALHKGTGLEQDRTIGTGCVYTDDHGKHHIFYTGINPHLRNETHYSQALMHATSDDLLSWTKISGEVWYPDDSTYERHDWRDPFIFKHPKTGRYSMLIAARLKAGSAAGRGCTALLSSDDLTKWTVEKPFYAPGRYHGHECPDWFQIGDWYYLVFSEYTTHTVTRYVMSHSPDGPWFAPDDNQFDNRAFYAAKTASDGKRRFLFGWNPSKLGDSDKGDWQWGGCQSVHEVIQQPDGTLTVRIPPEAESAFGKPSPVQCDVLEPGWIHTTDTYSGQAPYGYSAALSQSMPETYLLQGEIRFERNVGRAGILIRMDEHGDSGYFLRFDPKGQRLEFGKVGGYRSWYVDNMPELDRPLKIEVNSPLRFKIVVDKTAVVAYVNDQIALSGRMYSNPFGRCGLFVDGTSVTVSAFESRTLNP